MGRLVAILSVALGACLPSSGPAVSSQEPEVSRIERFAMDPFEEPIGHSLALGNAKQQIDERFGDPQKLETWKADDRTGTGQLIFARFTYPGLVLVVGEGDDQSRSWIESVELFEGHPSLKFGLGVGVSADTVATTFAPANSVRTAGAVRLATPIYEDLNDISVESYVELTFELDGNGVVQRILIETIAL
jgi:hypothetical protein